jgi:hypothetical protein
MMHLVNDTACLTACPSVLPAAGGGACRAASNDGTNKLTIEDLHAMINVPLDSQ